MRTYLFLPNISQCYFMLEGLVYAFSGGYNSEEDCTDILPFIYSAKESDSEIAEKVALLTKSYREAKNNFKKQQNLLKQQVSDPSVFEGRRIGGLRSDDRVVIYCYIKSGNKEIKETIDIIQNIREGCADIQINVVCEFATSFLHDDETRWNTKCSLDILNEISSVVFVGKQEDINNKDYKSMRALIALLDTLFNNKAGTPVPGRGKEGMSYNQRNLQSVYVAKCFERLLLLSSIIDLSRRTELTKWREKLNVDSDFIKDMWDSEPLRSLHGIIKHFNSWIQQIDSSDFCFETIGLDNAITELNKIKSLKIGIDNDSKRSAGWNSILSVVEKNIPVDAVTKGCSGKYSVLSEPFYGTDERHIKFDNAVFKDVVSKSLYHYIAGWAFEEDLLNNVFAKKIRSAILDVWCTFFLGKADTNGYTIKEYILTEKSDFSKEYTMTKLWDKLVEQEIFYRITLPNEVEVESSPYTGFAFDIRSFEAYSSPIKDLKERPLEFQQFIYAYISMFPKSFSKEFREYIHKQTQNAVKGMDSDKMNIFCTYPQMCTHVGINF